jgi:hypothetical protein
VAEYSDESLKRNDHHLLTRSNKCEHFSTEEDFAQLTFFKDGRYFEEIKKSDETPPKWKDFENNVTT